MYEYSNNTLKVIPLKLGSDFRSKLNESMILVYTEIKDMLQKFLKSKLKYKEKNKP